MTHVRITSKGDGGYSLFVDEHDLSYQILHDVQVVVGQGQPALVLVTLVADTLDADLVDGIVTPRAVSA